MLGLGRRNFKKMESLVVLMWTFMFGLLPRDGNENIGGCYFTSLTSQDDFGAKVICIVNQVIYLVTQYHNAPI